MKIFDEKEAVAFIKAAIAPERLSDEDILDIIDVIFDYYDDNGDLDLDFDEYEEEDGSDDDLGAITAYARGALCNTDIPAALISKVIEAELAYENSLL